MNGTRVWACRGGGVGISGGGPAGVVGVRALVIVFVLLVAVFHGDALHASFPHRGRGLLQRQPVAHRVVHLAVEGGVEDALQAEVPVLFLQGVQQCDTVIFIIIVICLYFSSLTDTQIF